MKNARQHTVYTGTSNIVVPGNKQSLPEAFHDKTRLQYYGKMFNTALRAGRNVVYIPV